MISYSHVDTWSSDMSFKTKYDTHMTALYKMRVTPEQKQLLSLASASADYESMSDFWRNYNVYSAEMLLKLNSGEITAEEFGKRIADYLREHVLDAAVEDEP